MKTGRLAGGSDTTYVYNALGQRVKKSGGAILSPLYFMYDEAGHLVGEYDSSGNLIQETVWLGDIPVATLRPNGANVDVFYVHTDQLNTPRKVTRPSDNALRWTWDPTPFGEGVPEQNPAGIGSFVYNLRFPGQQFDVETNLNYNYFRNYDPSIGRYVESDPIGLTAGPNTFSYVRGSPTSRSDAWGLLPGGAFPLCNSCHGGGGIAAPPAPPVLPVVPTNPWDWHVPKSKPGTMDPPNGGDDDCPDGCDEMKRLELMSCHTMRMFWEPIDEKYANGYWQRCTARAWVRWRMCKSNKGQLPSDAPPPWSDADEQGHNF